MLAGESQTNGAKKFKYCIYLQKKLYLPTKRIYVLAIYNNDCYRGQNHFKHAEISLI